MLKRWDFPAPLDRKCSRKGTWFCSPLKLCISQQPKVNRSVRPGGKRSIGSTNHPRQACPSVASETWEQSRVPWSVFDTSGVPEGQRASCVSLLGGSWDEAQALLWLEVSKLCVVVPTEAGLCGPMHNSPYKKRKNLSLLDMLVFCVHGSYLLKSIQYLCSLKWYKTQTALPLSGYWSGVRLRRSFKITIAPNIHNS